MSVFCLDCNKRRNQSLDGRCEVCGSGALDPYLESFGGDVVLMESYRSPAQVLIGRVFAGMCIGVIGTTFLVLCWLATLK